MSSRKVRAMIESGKGGARRAGAMWATGMIAVAAAVGLVAVALWSIFAYRHAVFSWDIWDTVEFYRDFREGRGSWAALWSLHNEHRIVFPRLLILLDYGLFQASGFLLLFLLLALHGAHAGLLAAAFARGARGRAALLYACIVAMAFFWLKQRENFVWPFQVAWMMNAFFASLAAWLAATRPSARGLLAAAACCAVAALSLASGVLMPFVIGVVLWRAGVPKRRLAAWAAFAVGLVAVYMAGYAAPADKFDDQAAPSPFGALLFAAAYLGNPLMAAGVSPAFAVALGLAGMAVFAALAVRFLRGPRAAPPDASSVTLRDAASIRFALSVAAYALAMALVTAWGREMFGLATAASSRYVTTSLVFWMALLGGLVSQVGPATRKRILLAALAACVAYLLPTQVLFAGKMRDTFVEHDEGALALIAGVEDSAALYALYPKASALWNKRAVLRDDGLSVYREGWARSVGEAWSGGEDGGPRGDGRLRAVLDEVRRVDRAPRSGYFVRGRLEGGADELPDVLLLMRGDTVAGAARRARRACRECFSGYVSGDGPAFGILAWEGDGRPGRRVALSPRTPSP